MPLTSQFFNEIELAANSLKAYIEGHDGPLHRLNDNVSVRKKEAEKIAALLSMINKDSTTANLNTILPILEKSLKNNAIEIEKDKGAGKFNVRIILETLREQINEEISRQASPPSLDELTTAADHGGKVHTYGDGVSSGRDAGPLYGGAPGAAMEARRQNELLARESKKSPVYGISGDTTASAVPPVYGSVAGRTPVAPASSSAVPPVYGSVAGSTPVAPASSSAVPPVYGSVAGRTPVAPASSSAESPVYGIGSTPAASDAASPTYGGVPVGYAPGQRMYGKISHEYKGDIEAAKKTIFQTLTIVRDVQLPQVKKKPASLAFISAGVDAKTVTATIIAADLQTKCDYLVALNTAMEELNKAVYPDKRKQSQPEFLLYTSLDNLKNSINTLVKAESPHPQLR